MINAAAIKATGYAISTLSVILLGFVSWQSAHSDPVLSLCLVAGIVTSIAGMGLRWLSYRVDETKNEAVNNVGPNGGRGT